MAMGCFRHAMHVFVVQHLEVARVTIEKRLLYVFHRGMSLWVEVLSTELHDFILRALP